MNKDNIAGFDLNLLVVFNAIMEERKVTGAAAKLGLTQPAVSHALNRLRTLLRDPLFVRTPTGMAPTCAAMKLADAIRPELRRIGEALAIHDEFDPATSCRQFTVGLSDYASLVLLPGLLERMRREAPNATLTVRNTCHGEGLVQLEEEEVELIVGNFPEPPPHCGEKLLYEETFLCAGRREHPALRKTLTMKRYLASEHLQVSTRGEPHGYIDKVLDKMGVRRTVRATVGFFLVAPLLLPDTDLLATEPSRLFLPVAEQFDLTLKPVPFAIPPFPVTQIWHSRHTPDTGHGWLRNLIEQCAYDE